jgi:HNH endonuclease
MARSPFKDKINSLMRRDSSMMQNRAVHLSIHERALSLAQTFLGVEAELLKAINEVDLQRVYESFHLTSTFAYCLKILGLSEGATSYFITVARKMRDVPELGLAIEQGELSVSKAARVVSVLTTENQEELLGKASKMTKNEIEKEVARLAPGKRKRATMRSVGEDRQRVTAELSSSYAGKLKRVQDLESQRKSKVVAIETAIESALDAYLEKYDPLKKAERSRMKPSKAKPSRKLDATTQHAVMKRDHAECQEIVDGEKCCQKRWIDVHHIIEVQNGGTNELSNLITLCRGHHRLRHKNTAQAVRSVSAH